MAPSSDADVARLVDAQSAQRDKLRDALAVAVAKLVMGWPDFYSAEMVAKFLTAFAKLVEPAQARAAATTDAYLSRAIGDLRGKPTPPVGVRIDPTQLRGTNHLSVLERVAEEYRYQRSAGLDDTAARERSVQRAQAIADDDVTLASREATRQVFTRTPGVSGYRRVIHPELSREGTCGLCVAASDRVYHRGDLMPIHTHCRCEPMPIIGTADPGHSLNQTELAALYARSGSTSAADLSRVRVRNHGELGPVLTEDDEHFTGPAAATARAA